MSYSIYTDGGASPNDGTGVGAWAIVIIANGNVPKTYGGWEPKSTNNQMELRALDEALQYIYDEHETLYWTIYSDSQYAINVLNGEWEAKENLEQLKSLWMLYKKVTYRTTLTWVKGHADDGDVHSLHNDMADKEVKRQFNIAILEQ
jgi:ribonuclease HI